MGAKEEKCSTDFEVSLLIWIKFFRTETFDDEKTPDEDPEHWKVFAELHKYLESRFPLMCVSSTCFSAFAKGSNMRVLTGSCRHSNLTVTKVNTYALIFHWQGSNKDLKPILLTSHQGM